MEPDTPSTITSRSSQSSRGTIGTTTFAMAKTQMFDSSDDEIKDVTPETPAAKTPTGMHPHEIDWFDVKSLDLAVRTFCEKHIIDQLPKMSNADKVREIFRTLPPRVTKSLYQGVALGSGCLSMKNVLGFFHTDIEGKSDQREKLAYAMVDLLKMIVKTRSTTSVNATESVFKGAASKQTSSASGNLKADEIYEKKDDGSGGSNQGKKIGSVGKMVNAVSFNNHGGGVVVHNDGNEVAMNRNDGNDSGIGANVNVHGFFDEVAGMHDDDFGFDEDNGAMFDINDDSPGNGFQLANYNPGGNISRANVNVASNQNARQSAGRGNQLAVANDRDGVNDGVQPVDERNDDSDDVDPLGDIDFSSNVVAIPDRDAERFDVVFSKPIISVDGSKANYLFFFASRNKAWWLKAQFMSIGATNYLKHLALTNPRLAANLKVTFANSFTETNRRIPGDVQDRLMKTMNGKTVPIMYGIMDLDHTEGMTIEQKANVVFNTVFKKGFKLYPNAKTNRGKSFLDYCNANGHDGLATFLVTKYGDGDETSTANALSVELDTCFNNPGVQFEWNASLDRFLCDWDIKRFLISDVKATGWDDLTDNDKEACYRAYDAANPNRLPNWNAMVKHVFRPT